jgi:hypothetical protein
MSSLLLAFPGLLCGCDDPQTGSLKLDVSQSEIEKEINKLGNPGQSAAAQPKPGAARRPTPSRP